MPIKDSPRLYDQCLCEIDDLGTTFFGTLEEIVSKYKKKGLKGEDLINVRKWIKLKFIE